MNIGVELLWDRVKGVIPPTRCLRGEYPPGGAGPPSIIFTVLNTALFRILLIPLASCYLHSGIKGCECSDQDEKMTFWIASIPWGYILILQIISHHFLPWLCNSLSLLFWSSHTSSKVQRCQVLRISALKDYLYNNSRSRISTLTATSSSMLTTVIVWQSRL